MGGLGSGRHDYATTPTVRECRCLDVNKLTEVVKQPGAAGTYRWGPRDDPSATIGIHALPDNADPDQQATALELAYTERNTRTGETTDRQYSVPIEYTECNFGGERPWFRCPGVVNDERCGRRVAKIYALPSGGLYLCRHCHDLGYRSSRTSGDEMKQAELRFRRAYAKVDEQGRRPHPNDLDVPRIPDRPTGMHHDTYEDLLADLERAREEWDQASFVKLQQISSMLA